MLAEGKGLPSSGSWTFQGAENSLQLAYGLCAQTDLKVRRTCKKLIGLILTMYSQALEICPN